MADLSSILRAAVSPARFARPTAYRRSSIEAFAYRQLGATETGGAYLTRANWNFCNRPQPRPNSATMHLNCVHWFLIDATMAERWATAEARCRACGGEMVLINVIEDMSMPVVGLERRAYTCSACGLTEQRTAINKLPRKKQNAEIMPRWCMRPARPDAHLAALLEAVVAQPVVLLGACARGTALGVARWV